MPNGDLVEARALDAAAETEETCAGRPSVPISANAAPPSVTMSSTLIRLSTLFTTVGLEKRPESTGNGGLERGSPR